MSEITRGVMGMPYEMVMDSEMSRRQFYAIARQVYAENESMRADVDRFEWVKEYCDIDYRGHRPDGDYSSTNESVDAAMAAISSPENP